MPAHLSFRLKGNGQQNLTGVVERCFRLGL